MSEVAEFTNETKDLASKIASLTMAQAKDLVDYLGEEYNIEPATAGAMIGMVVEDIAPPPPPEPTTVSVILKEVGAEKIAVIKVIREITSLGLKEAKNLADTAPQPIKENIEKEEAEAIAKKFEAVGAKIEIK